MMPNLRFSSELFMNDVKFFLCHFMFLFCLVIISEYGMDFGCITRSSAVLCWAVFLFLGHIVSFQSYVSWDYIYNTVSEAAGRVWFSCLCNGYFIISFISLQNL